LKIIVRICFESYVQHLFIEPRKKHGPMTGKPEWFSDSYVYIACLKRK